MTIAVHTGQAHTQPGRQRLFEMLMIIILEKRYEKEPSSEISSGRTSLRVRSEHFC